MKKLQCEMKADCKEPVTHIDGKGYIYCRECGERRNFTLPCRELAKWELKQLTDGKTLEKY